MSASAAQRLAARNRRRLDQVACDQLAPGRTLSTHGDRTAEPDGLHELRDRRRVGKLEVGLPAGHGEPDCFAGQPDRYRGSAATPMAATVHAWFVRSAASAPQVILTKSERVVSVDMAAIVAEGVAVLITRFSGLAPWEAQYGYSRVVVAGDWAITAGTTATGLEGVLHPGDPYRQTLAALQDRT